MKLKKAKRTTLFALIATVLCAVIAAVAGLFGGFGASVQTADATATGTSVGTLGTNGSFTASVLQKLMGGIMGQTTAEYGDLKDYMKGVKTVSSADMSLHVSFGGKTWNVVYASETKTGDVVATLWLASSTTTSKYNNWAADTPTDAYPSNMYSSSKIRSYLTGSSYVASKGATTLTAGSQNSTWQTFVGQYGNYIATPSEIAYQETEHSLSLGVGSYNFPNEAYGTPSQQNWYSGYNYSSKATYSDWKNDKIWLPSYAEAGEGGIWATKSAQRANTDAPSWLRSGNYNYANYAFSLSTSGDIDYDGVHGTYAVRPALHLNLKSAAKAAGLTVPDDPIEPKVSYTSTMTYGDTQTLSVTGNTGNASVSWVLKNDTGKATLSSTTAAKPTLTATQAGTVKVYAKVAATSGYQSGTTPTVTITIDKKSISPTLSYTTVTYGSDSDAPTVGGNSGSGSVSFSVANDTGKATINASTGVLTPVQAGTVNVTVSIGATTNYASGSKTVKVTINKADISPTLSYTTVTYGSNSDAPTVGGNSGSGTVSYSVTNGTGKATINSSTGVLTPTQAGTVDVKVSIGATTNYNSGSKTVKVTIDKASFDMTNVKWNYSSAFTYDGNAKSVAITGLPTGLTASYSGTTSATNAGSYTAKAAWTYSTTNYNAPEAIADCSWTINKANQAAVTVTGNATMLYGDAITLTASGGNGTGAYTWSVATYLSTGGTATLSATTGASVTLTATHVGTVRVTLTRAASTNYNAATAIYHDIVISKATPTANAALGANAKCIAGQMLITVPITGTSSVGGTFAWTTPSQVMSVGAANYAWTFTPTDGVNYNNVTGNLSITALGMDSITARGQKTAYKAFEKFTTDGMTVYAVASGVERAVTGYTYTVDYGDGRDSFRVSDSGCNVTITYTEGDKTKTFTFTVTVEKADVDMSGVTFANKVVTFDRELQTITYGGTLPDGVAFNKYTYDGVDNNNGVRNAGTYAVEALFSVADTANYNAPKLKATLTINKATPQVTVTVAKGTYYVGDKIGPIGLTADTLGTVEWKNPEEQLLTVNGTYQWVFTPNDTDNYITANGTVQVVACFKLTGITVTGAQTAYKAHESFDTTGMVVTASYAMGKVDTAVEGYTVAYPTAGATEFLISDDGKSMTVSYTENGITVTTTIEITIIANSYDMSGVTMGDLKVTYDGTAHSIVISGTLPTGVKVTGYTYNGDAGTGAINAGTYTVAAVFEIADPENYKMPTMSATLTIEQATPEVTVKVEGDYHYIGDQITEVTITTTADGTVVWSKTDAVIASEEGTYAWTYTPNDTVNYTTTSGTVTINASYKLTGITVTGATTEYKAHESFKTDGLVVTATYQAGKADTAVNGYTIAYPTDGATEFVLADDGKSVTISYTESGITKTATIEITINANSYDMSGVSMDDLTVTYDGTAHSIIISGDLPAGVKVTGYTYNGTANTGAMNAGTYTVEAVIEIADPDNYKMPTLSATLTIEKAQGVIDVSGVKTDYTYNGKLQTVSSGAKVNNLEQTIVYTDNTFTTVTEGNGLVVTISVDESDNYLADSKTVTLTVNKATPTLDVSKVETQYTYTGKLQKVESGATVDNDEQTVFYSNNQFTTVEQGNGLEVKISVPASANYNAASATVTITVKKATVADSVTFTDKTVTYDGASHTLTIDGELADDITVTYLYNGAEFTGATEVDSYEITVHFECTSGNYEDPEDMTATLTIDPYEVSDDEVTNIDETYEYTGASHKPDPIVKVTLADGETTLTSGSYSVKYSTEEYVAGTEVTVTVTFSGNYSGTVEKTFTVTKAKLTLEWEEEDYVYNNTHQGVTVSGIKGLASSDAGVLPTIKYVGNGDTSYGESTTKPMNAGTYKAVAELSEALFDNYEYSAANVLEKFFEIKKADVTVTVGINEADKYYEGSGLPAIMQIGDATSGSLTVLGEVAWQQSGDEPLSLEFGTNDYIWIFTPDDGDNFNIKTGAISIKAEQTTIIGLTVEWKSGIEIPKLYTSTTLKEVRQYLTVRGELAGNQGYVDIVGYQISGSWGTEPCPPTDKAGTHILTVAFNGKKATLTNVVYHAILVTDLKIEAATPNGIKKNYEGLDEFDRTSIIVTVVYNDGTTVEVNDYKLVYEGDRDKLWAGDRQVTVTYNNGSLEEDMQRVIEGLTVTTKTFDMSNISIEPMVTDYDGNVKGYTIKGDFTIGSVSYTYAKITDDGEFTVPEASVKDAGTYRVRVKFTLEGDENLVNYEDINTVEVLLTVNKVDYENLESIGFDVTSADYNDGNSVADKITVKNVPKDVTVSYEYKDKDGKVLSAEEVINAGKYTVTVSFKVDDNHYPIAPIVTEFTINKKSPVINPTVGGSLSKGTKLYQLTFVADDSDTHGTFTWVNDEQELQAGINRCYYTFTPDDATNYETVKGYIDLSVGAMSNEEIANSGGLSTGATVGLIIAIVAVFLIAIIALLAALRKPKAYDPDGFNDPVSDEDLK